MSARDDLAMRRRRSAKGIGPINGIRARMETLLDSLAPTSHRIAEFILAHAEDVIHMSVTKSRSRPGRAKRRW